MRTFAFVALAGRLALPAWVDAAQDIECGKHASTLRALHRAAKPRRLDGRMQRSHKRSIVS